MLLILAYTIVVLMVGYGISRTDRDWLIENLKERRDKNSNFITFSRTWCFVFFIIFLIVFTATKWGSYDRYVDLRTTYDATVEQYAGAIEMYQGKAVIDVEKAAFTDLKYQGYQENIATFIANLRHVVVKYNKGVIGKRLYKKNPFFGIFIYNVDPDMKLLSLKTASQRQVKE